MCGLVALIGTREDIYGVQAIQRALDQMQRRGPDAEEIWQEDGTALGHRRLAIIDLDPRAAQPMHSLCGRYVIVFNGEIYNYQELRQSLQQQGVDFRTNSDTEVLLALFARDGECMLEKLAGMFAFVIWDRMARKGFVARDPYGIKPLYMAKVQGGGVAVASQVKALLAIGCVSREPDPVGQAGYWLLGSVPEPHTWFRDIQHVPAGCAAWIEGGRLVRQWRWHDIGDAWRNAQARAGDVGPAEVRAAVSSALRESVRRHLVADVPVGVFLSGGVDSGAMAALMVEQGARGLVGVTIAFDEFIGTQADEAPTAALVARHYGIRHVLRKVTRAEFQADLPRILAAMDQPSIDGINTWYASKAVAELGLKVVVSGLGGDELFQGYSHFRTLPRLLQARRGLRWLPGMAAALSALGNLQARRSGNLRWQHLAEWSSGIEGLWWLRRSVHAPEELIDRMGKEMTSIELQHCDVVELLRSLTGLLPQDPHLAIGQIESMTYLRNQLLRDSDWASMDHSVELRTPLVDARLLGTLAPWLPHFVRHPGKALLAHAPQRALPNAILTRPKTGFGIPLQAWLGQPGASLRDAWSVRAASAYDLAVAA